MGPGIPSLESRVCSLESGFWNLQMRRVREAARPRRVINLSRWRGSTGDGVQPTVLAWSSEPCTDATPPLGTPHLVLPGWTTVLLCSLCRMRTSDLGRCPKPPLANTMVAIMAG